MEYNKVYFNIYSDGLLPDAEQTTNGFQMRNFNFRRLLGGLYDQYNAFSIKLEAFCCRSNNTATIASDYLLCHLTGLNFINNYYDSSPSFNNSRVLEIIDFSVSSANNPFSFLSNCNSSMFYKPTPYIVDLTLFFSRISDGAFVSYPDGYYFIFSITGVDAYRVKPKLTNSIIPRLANTNTINFTLNSRNAQILDTRRRTFRFNNIDLRSIIGSSYYKYNRFNLITRCITLSQSSGTDFISGTFSYNTSLFLSGLAFITESRSQYSSTNSTMAVFHPDIPAAIGCVNILNSQPNETYIENAFYKSAQTVNLTITYNSMYSFVLNLPNTGTTTQYPHFTINFDIIPII